MFQGPTSMQGAGTARSYIGHHRTNEKKGEIVMFPLGSRNRVEVNQIYLVGNAEEAESVDRYDKFT